VAAARRWRVIVLAAAAAAVLAVAGRRASAPGDATTGVNPNRALLAELADAGLPEAAFAQSPLPARLTMLDPRRARQGRWVYRRHTEIGGAVVAGEWTDTLEVRATTLRGIDAWLVRWAGRAGLQATTLDSAWVTRDSLVPLRRWRAQPRNSVTHATDYFADSIVRTVATDGRISRSVQRWPSALPQAGRLLMVTAWRFSIQLLPLRAGWRGQIGGVAEPGAGGTGTVALGFRVVGEDTVTVPAGRFDCWKVTWDVKTPPPIPPIWWVDKRSGSVIQEEISGLATSNTPARRSVTRLISVETSP
jgi:hypothetical protein